MEFKNKDGYTCPEVYIISLPSEGTVCTWSSTGEISDDKWNNLYDDED